MTIRTRLTFLFASLLAVVLLLFSAATLSVLNWVLRNQVDSTLLNAADDIYEPAYDSIVHPTAGSGMADYYGLRPDLYYQVWRLDDNSQRAYPYYTSWSMLALGYDALDPAALESESELRRDVMVNGTHLRVVTRPLLIDGEHRGYIQVASSLRTVDAAMDRLLKIMLIGGAVTLLSALFLGDFLTRRALQPIDVIAQTAQQITEADDLSMRIPYNGPPDEIGQLAGHFNDTMERLERLFQSQRRFVADVSHEMRTPLTTIQGNLDLIRRFGPDDEAIDDIDSEARRMSRLVEDLLLLAKADAGHLPLEKRTVELDTLVLEVFNQAHLLDRHGVTLKLGQIDQAHVLGDADRLKQLLFNLVTNGLKYTEPGGSVTISMSRAHNQVAVNVADTGVGIPADHLAHIFDRFYRVEKHRSRAMGGTGLGLSIAKWIADAHGGVLTVESEVGTGTTFTLRLPVVPRSIAQDARRATHTTLPAVVLSESHSNGR